MEIYLKSKEHGKKIASAKAESDLDKLNGWIEVSKDDYFNADGKAEVDNVAMIKKRGRPPINKLSE